MHTSKCFDHQAATNHEDVIVFERGGVAYSISPFDSVSPYISIRSLPVH